MTTTYDVGFQTKIVAMALRDDLFMQRVEGLIDPKYFDADTHAYLADMANRHFGTYRTPPSMAIVIKGIRDAKAAKLVKDDFVEDLKILLKTIYSPAADLSNRDYMVDEVAKFARERAIEGALSKGIDILEAKGDYAEIVRLIREAETVGATEGSGTLSMTASVKDRIKKRLDRIAGHTGPRGITSGYRELDELLFHKGWGRKELVVLMGAAKSGKSMGLSQFALNAALAGFKVLYVTVENSADVTSDRMDACLGKVPLKDVDTSGVSILKAWAELEGKGGLVEVVEFPMGQAKVSDIRRVVRKFQAKGVVFDLLVVDYADEMQSEKFRDEERHNLSSIYTDLRALCTEENFAGLTATQTNRTGAKATTATGTDVAEDFGKVRKADAFITINATEEERKSGQMRLYLANMRNSEGGITLHCSNDRSRMIFINRVLKVA